ncbi:MAG TPA: hypothetical protein VK176_00770 [Phycisphaerales bacterium]|nr:hypothetical protein [Phycisphaerales bacterium]
MTAAPSSSSDLLKMLGGSGGAARLRPAGDAQALDPAELTRSGSFSQLLAAARAGKFKSDIPVQAHRQSGVELTPEQVERLNVACDMAQAAGATRALVKIDGMNLLLDVGARTITSKVDVAPGQVVTGIDAMIEVPAGKGDPTLSTLAGALGLHSPRLSGVSDSLARALEAPPAS